MGSEVTHHRGRSNRPDSRRRFLLRGAQGVVVGAAWTGCRPAPDDQKTTIELDTPPDGERRQIIHKGLTIEVRRENASVIATLLLCTHQGCTVKWDGRGYACPCHGGYYSVEGRPTLGPPRRPLRRLPVRMSHGRVFVALEGL